MYHSRDCHCFSVGQTTPKIVPFCGGESRPHLIHGSPTPVSPHGISIGSAVFAGLTNVTHRHTDRQTDRPRYSVGNNRPRLATAAVRPNNDNIIVSISTMTVGSFILCFGEFVGVELVKLVV